MNLVKAHTLLCSVSYIASQLYTIYKHLYFSYAKSSPTPTRPCLGFSQYSYLSWPPSISSIPRVRSSTSLDSCYHFMNYKIISVCYYHALAMALTVLHSCLSCHSPPLIIGLGGGSKVQ